MNKSNQSSDDKTGLEMPPEGFMNGIHGEEVNWQPLLLQWINSAEINKRLFHFSDVQSEVVVVFQLIHFLSNSAGAASRSGKGKPWPGGRMQPVKIVNPAYRYLKKL